MGNGNNREDLDVLADDTERRKNKLEKVRRRAKDPYVW